MIEQINKYPVERKFRFVSYLAYIFLYQNIDFFDEQLKLSIFDEKGRKMPVSVWTPLLSSTFDYYAFSDHFLTLILQDLLGEEYANQLTLTQTDFMQNFTPRCDWFFGADFTFI